MNPYAQHLGAVEAIFAGKASTLGMPEQPTKAGFMELARSGREVWNAWRHEYPEPTADFSEVTFVEKANFAGYIFALDKNGKGPSFRRAEFPKGARFEDAFFGKSADFTGAVFSWPADFSRSVFGKGADFDTCQFRRITRFTDAQFGESARFTRCEFIGSAKFEGARFDDDASFFRAKMGRQLNFSGSRFKGKSTFKGATFGPRAIFTKSIFIGSCDFSAETKEDTPSTAKYFHTADFQGCQFHSESKFSNREFLDRTNFGRADPEKADSATMFHGIPIFHACKFHQDTSFDDARFLAPPSQEAARAYRTLKLAMEQLKATRGEQIFFRLEMEAEHHGLEFWSRFMSSIYSATSDYGFSLRRPIAALFLAALLLGCVHGWLANLHAGHDGFQALVFTSTEANASRTLQWLRYVAINTLPVPGFDKTQMELRDALFGKDGAIVSIAMGLEMIHKVISLGCVFLLGLALRNLFKMKS